LHGLNAKLPEFAAAIGLAMLDEFPERKRRRMDIHGWYREELAERGMLAAGWTTQREAGEVPHQFFPLLCPEQFSNQAVVKSMAAHAVEVRTYFCPACHEQPAFDRFPRSDLTNTQTLSARALSLPLWEEISREQIQHVVGHLHP
jgi:dTDP-4-amino-4,6-dideoxygalactose transaminase